ncbi:MAG: histidine phosphatase family protein [Candidatus Parcubacteria bacterium]|nr:histidine phosphatase family protein [Candidatus Parcubacteria bacterium]
MHKNNDNFCTLYLVRHGETEWNKNGIIQGQLDSPLTNEGLSQVKQTAQELKDIHFDAIFSSDLHRAQKSAEIIKLERQLAIQTSKALRERTFGHYEGTSGEKYREKFQQLIEKVKQLSDEDHKAFKFDKDIESDEEVIGRFITQLREIAVAYPNKTVIVVTHGGCIRTFLMHMGYVKYSELPAGALLENAGYVKVLCDGVDFFIQEVKGISNQTLK